MSSIYLELNKRNLISNEPGIYKFYDQDHKIIYVGKAKNLKKRVNSYFVPSAKHSIKTKKMIKQIKVISYTVVFSEYEALLLENNLIKNHQPKYNILLRDDKTYPFICITKERFPRIISVRNPKSSLGTLYGPYTDIGSMNKILNLIFSIFKIRTCKYNLSQQNIEKKKFKVCLEYHIKNCKGPCENLQTEEDYNLEIEKIKEILKGNFAEVKKNLREKMKAFAKELKFVKSQDLKEKIEALDNFYQKTLIINPSIAKDIDIFAIKSYDNEFYISFIKLVKGMITFTENLIIKKKLDEKNEDTLTNVIIFLREKTKSEAHEVITNISLKIENPYFKIICPKKGDKKKLLELAIKNVLVSKQQSLLQKDIQKKIKNKTLEFLQEDLDLKNFPKQIECFDNSNLQGTDPVSSMVCFINGKPSKSNYRKYNIKTVKGINDFASMKEVVKRRYSKLIEENKKLPELIIIDGGKGQLSFAIQALKELNIFEKVEIISIAKRLEEIYKPYDQYPLFIDKLSPSLKLIQKIRNEAHRFAITFHKQKREKSTISSELDNIKGIGKKTKETLLKSLKSVSIIKNTPLESIEDLVGKSKAKIIFDYFKNL